MIKWTGLAPWEFEFPFPGSLTSTFLQVINTVTLALELAARERQPTGPNPLYYRDD